MAQTQRTYSTHKKAVDARRRGEINRELRVWVPTDDGKGYWYAKYAPTTAHGRSSGVSYWHCHCPPCQAYAVAVSKKSRETRAFNRAILKDLNQDPNKDLDNHNREVEDQAREAPAVPTDRAPDVEDRSEPAPEPVIAQPTGGETPSGPPHHSSWDDYRARIMGKLRGN